MPIAETVTIDLDARGIPDGDRDVSELPHDAAEISIRDQASLFGKSRHFFETFREILQPA